MLAGLNYEKKLGGIISLSATFPSELFLKKEEHIKCPIFARIGILDQVFHYRFVKITWTEVASRPNVDYKEERIAHEINLEILQ